MKGIFITGTDTDVGKTFISGLILKQLRQAGKKAVYYKAALSGAEKEGEVLIPGDAAYVCEQGGVTLNPFELVTYVFEEAVSPHLAAKLHEQTIELEKIKAHHQQLAASYEFVLAEGSGGIVCPLNMTSKPPLLLEDVIKALGYEAVIVAHSGVGTINHTFLTVHYMRNQGIPIKGIILNGYEAENVAHEDNAKVIETLTGLPILAYVPKGATAITIDL